MSDARIFRECTVHQSRRGWACWTWQSVVEKVSISQPCLKRSQPCEGQHYWPPELQPPSPSNQPHTHTQRIGQKKADDVLCKQDVRHGRFAKGLTPVVGFDTVHSMMVAVSMSKLNSRIQLRADGILASVIRCSPQDVVGYLAPVTEAGGRLIT